MLAYPVTRRALSEGSTAGEEWRVRPVVIVNHRVRAEGEGFLDAFARLGEDEGGLS